MDNLNLREIVMKSTEEYQKYVNEFTDNLLNDYRHNIKEYTYDVYSVTDDSPFLKDKLVLVDVDDALYEMNNGNFLSVLFIFNVINKLINNNIEVNDLNDYIFDPSNPEEFNCILDTIYVDFIEVEGIKNDIFNAISNLAKISGKFTSGTINLRDIYMLQKKDEDFREMLNFSVDENESFASMIKDIKENSNKIENVLKTKDSCYRPLIASGAGFNMKQASQVFNLIGPKPNIFGNLHDKAILTNFLNGLRDQTDFFINADNCRKA